MCMTVSGTNPVGSTAILTKRCQCVIVGAGVAGLSAAARLEEAGVDFVLVEAGDRVGGRIHTHQPSRGAGVGRPLELGAQWLHGTKGNPLFDWCEAEGIFDSPGEFWGLSSVFALFEINGSAV
ncbi:unnamed protein product [Choristocarpus tenellus]